MGRPVRYHDSAHVKAREEQRLFRERHPDYHRLRQRKIVAAGYYRTPKWNHHARLRHRMMRYRAIQKLGGKCEVCWQSTFEFLTLDHIHGDGRAERKARGQTCNGTLYRDILNDKVDLSRYRVLCWNHNSALGAYDYSPDLALRTLYENGASEIAA